MTESSGDRTFDVDTAARAVVTLLEAYGFAETDPILARTPRRVALTFAELFAGVNADPHEPLHHGDPAPDGVGLVVLRDLGFRSVCAHHLLPFSGKVHVAYLPGSHLFGIGSIIRSLEILSTRPQLQENLSQQLADALQTGGHAQGALVMIEARHSCIADRGPREAASRLITTAARGLLDASREGADALRLLAGPVA